MHRSETSAAAQSTGRAGSWSGRGRCARWPPAHGPKPVQEGCARRSSGHRDSSKATMPALIPEGNMTACDSARLCATFVVFARCRALRCAGWRLLLVQGGGRRDVAQAPTSTGVGRRTNSGAQESAPAASDASTNPTTRAEVVQPHVHALLATSGRNRRVPDRPRARGRPRGVAPPCYVPPMSGNWC